jgi:hypothetical protein
MMPPADIDLDDLPSPGAPAALGAISVDGYCQPAIEKPKDTRTDEEKAAFRERAKRFGQRARNAL